MKFKVFMLQKLFFCFCFSMLIHPTIFLYSLEDLEEGAQDFVLETKQISIPGYPHAFNPSLISFRGSYLLSFRVIPDPLMTLVSYIGLIWLDDDFNPMSAPQLLHTRSPGSPVPNRLEDARLFTVGEQLWIAYNDNVDLVITKRGFRQHIAKLDYDGEKFHVFNEERLTSFEGENPLVREKNWVPFDYNGTLLLSYSLLPHLVFRPLLEGTGACETIVSSFSWIDWKWGILRGGTPGLLDGEEYLAFFHSSKSMHTVHSNKSMPHYFIGAYTFSRDPPFEITKISPEPIVGKNFYKGKEYMPYWGSVRVVFPGGFIYNEDYIWLAYGRQDHEVWIAKLDKRQVKESLISISRVKQ